MRADTLERMAAEGKIDLAEFKGIHQQKIGQHYRFPFLLSTALYPEWPMAALRHTSESLNRKVAVALLEMLADSPAAKASQSAGWTVPSNYHPVHELLRQLRLPPYEDYGTFTLVGVIRKYWQILLVTLGLLLLTAGIAAHAPRLNRKLTLSRVALQAAHNHLETRVRGRTDDLEREIAERRRLEQQLRDQEGHLTFRVNHDALPIRALFGDRPSHAISRVKRSGERVGLMFLDIDNFKPVNDASGHAIGDQLLVEIAQRLRDSIRAGDTLARMGGDELVVLPDPLTDNNQTVVVEEKIRETLGTPMTIEGHELSVSTRIGIGIGIYPDDAEDSVELVRRADTAMYRAKETGTVRRRAYATATTIEVNSHAAIPSTETRPMTDQDFRIEHDSMGELKVPSNALWGAQTQRAIDNFPISELRMPRGLIRALGRIKAAAATTNHDLGLLDAELRDAIVAAATEVAGGRHDGQFPIDVFQTGSGTSTNMNANEVIAHLAGAGSGRPVHPNDHVNMGQSSNDVIPTAIHVSAALEIREQLLPALDHLAATIEARGEELRDVVKTGRTHLMDAMPLTLGQELSGWAAQVRLGIERIQAVWPHLTALAQGGTAIGTGINAHPGFGAGFASHLSASCGIDFSIKANLFEGLSSQDTAVEVSGQLKVIAVSLMKIANDLRWMNSGPLTGLGEIALPALQPGSSIMPGKVNPVIPEAVAMVCAQVIGNDTAITVAGQSGSFQLNVMLPVIAHNLLQSIELLASAARVLADKAIAGFTVNRERLREALEHNPILVTALNPVIGYEQGAATAKRAYAEGRPIREVAAEMTGLSDEELGRLLDPLKLTGSRPG